MSLNNPIAGPDWSSEYTVSAIPWVTSSAVSLGSTKEHEFGYVTQWVDITNLSASGTLSVAFTPGGLTSSYYFTVPANTSKQLDVRVKVIYISGSVGASSTSYSLVAGLTRIEGRQYIGMKNLPNV
jgi:hypothetical protein